MHPISKISAKKKQPTLKKRGGMVVGPFHHEETGGPKFQLKDTKDIIEEEGFEFNIPEEITNSKKVYTFTGKNIEIIHEILKLAGLSAFDKVTDVRAGDIVICIKSSWDDTIRTITGTIPEILSAINTSCGCKHIEDGAKVKEHGVDKTASFNPIPVKKSGGKISAKQKLNEWMMLNPNSPRWQKKKESITELSNNIHRLKLNISKDLNSDDEKQFLTALVIAIMIQTAERVGNEDSAKEGHVGVTGFLKKHVNVVGNKVLLEYQGKSGVEHEKSFSNEKIAKAVKKAIKNSSSKYLFETSDGFRIKVDKVNRYLSDFNISAKAIRGYCANKWIIENLNNLPIQETEKKRKKDFNAAVKKVAHRVGHGPATLRKHYMIPELPIEYINNGKIINIKKMGYLKDGGEMGDIPVEQYFLNPNEVPETVKEEIEKIEKKAVEEDKNVQQIFQEYPIEIVEWDAIVPTQDFLRSSKSDKLEKIVDIYSIHLPCFIKHDNKFYVKDGHHRAVDMHERVLPVKAHIYDIDKKHLISSQQEQNIESMKNAGEIKKQNERPTGNSGYYIYVVPTNKNFTPHIWIEGGMFTEKSKAEFQAQQMRKMKQDYNKKIPFYQSVQVVPVAQAEKIMMASAGGMPKDSEIIYWTLPKSTPIHKEGSQIIIEKQGEALKNRYGSYQLWKIYMKSPDGTKYSMQTGLSYEKAMKRGEDLKDTIESGYEILGIQKREKKMDEGGSFSMSPSPFGGTKNAEYRRSIELFEQVYKTKGLYFALALLYDSQYDRKDILAMMEILKPGKGKISDILKKTE